MKYITSGFSIYFKCFPDGGGRNLWVQVSLGRCPGIHRYGGMPIHSSQITACPIVWLDRKRNINILYLHGVPINLGGGGGGGGGGKGGGLHWQICWQLSVTFSATGLEHDFWGSP